MDAFEITVAGNPSAARTQAQQILGGKGFQLTWYDEWAASAEKGNAVKNALLGSFAQHIKVDLRIMSGQDNQSIVRFDKSNKGYVGGAIGVHKVNKNMKQLRDEYSAATTQAGTFVGVREQ